MVDPNLAGNAEGLPGKLAKIGYYHSIELPDGRVIPGWQSVDNQRWRISQFPIPEDLRGKRVLDVGAWDGWFSFEMERRGASVVAVDSTDRTQFREIKAMIGSKAEHVIADICHLTPRDVGYFDIVLFLGVLYHVKHPILALERVCELTTDLACIESFVTDEQPFGTRPAMEFYEGVELEGQFDNWMGPNISCLMAMCRTAGFARVDFKSVRDLRAHVICHRKWPEIARRGAAPPLMGVENAELLNHSFTAHRDDYLTAWISSEEPALTGDDILVQVGPYGAKPVAVTRGVGTAWQVNCKLPLGLAPGWHDVSVALRNSEWSNRVRIAVDLPREARVFAPALIVVENSQQQNHNFTGDGDYLTASISSEELDLTCDDIDVRVGVHGGNPETVRRVGATWQAVFKLPLGLVTGWYDVAVKVRESAWSNRAQIAVGRPREERVCTATTESLLKITGIYDGRTWERNQVRGGHGSCVSAWVAGLPDGVQRTEVTLRLDGTDLPACFVDPVGDHRGKQVNAMIPAGIDRGKYQLTVRYGNEESPIESVELF